MVEDRTGEPNSRPVTCDWCGIRLVSYAGVRIQMAEHDPLDYNWACDDCYEKIRHGEL
jgi:RNase P subunit RPR2